MKYPKTAEENKIQGEVIIELDMDSTCILSNLTIVKKLGFGCDEEAMRIVGMEVNAHNSCSKKCKVQKWVPKKIQHITTFKLPDD